MINTMDDIRLWNDCIELAKDCGIEIEMEGEWFTLNFNDIIICSLKSYRNVYYFLLGFSKHNEFQ